MTDGGSGASGGPRRVVISSVTGRPMEWDGTASAPRRTTGGAGAAPIVPDRASEDAPEPGSDTSNDSRLAQDVPPHWGRGA